MTWTKDYLFINITVLSLLLLLLLLSSSSSSSSSSSLAYLCNWLLCCWVRIKIKIKWIQFFHYCVHHYNHYRHHHHHHHHHQHPATVTRSESKLLVPEKMSKDLSRSIDISFRKLITPGKVLQFLLLLSLTYTKPQAGTHPTDVSRSRL